MVTGRLQLLADTIAGSTLTNLCENPSFENDIVGTFASTEPTRDLPTLSHSTTVGLYGTDSLKATGTGVGGHFDCIMFRKRDGSRFPVTAGKQYTWSMWVSGGAGASGAFHIAIHFYDSGGNRINALSPDNEFGLNPPGVGVGVFAVTSSMAWTQFSWTRTAPPTAATAETNIEESGASYGATDDIFIDGCMFIAGYHEAPAYFDGSIGGGTWTGTAHESTSTAPAGYMSGLFATDLTAYWERYGSYSHQGLGRQKELDEAGSAVFVYRLDNVDGRFSPDNTGSPYYPYWEPYVRIKVVGAYNSVAYDLFTGVIDTIKVDPEPKKSPEDTNGQCVHVTARDLMYVLERTETRLPMMPEQLTGVVIHRLLDYAEVGEIITNERFEQNTTGWSSISVTSFARVTSGDVLHSPAALAVGTQNSSGSGARNTVTATTTAGQKVTVSAYVVAENSDAIGKTVCIRVRDSNGIQAQSASVTLTDRYQQATVSGQYTTSAAARFVDVTTDAAQGVFTFRVGAGHAVPFESAIERSIDAGQSVLAFPFYHRETSALRAIQEVRDNEGGGLFFMDESGAAVFEDRHHRWKGDHLVSTVSLGERGRIDYTQNANDRIREVIFDYPKYVEATSQVWSLDRVPVAIGPNALATFEADFGGGLVRNATATFIAMSAAEAGVSETASATLTLVNYGGGATVNIQNNVARTIYVTSVLMDGTVIREASDLTPVRYEPAGGVPLGATLSHAFKWNAREPSITSWAEYVGTRYATQRERIALSLNSAWPEYDTAKPELTQFMARRVSDRITIANTAFAFSTKVSGDYYIDKIDRTITGENTAMTLQLSPCETETFFLLDSSALDGAHVLAA